MINLYLIGSRNSRAMLSLSRSFKCFKIFKRRSLNFRMLENGLDLSDTSNAKIFQQEQSLKKMDLPKLKNLRKKTTS